MVARATRAWPRACPGYGSGRLRPRPGSCPGKLSGRQTDGRFRMGSARSPAYEWGQEPRAGTPNNGSIVMSVRSLVSEPVRWPRVGALSAAFNLHGVAAALLLMAATVPTSTTTPVRPAPVMSVEIVEPPPIEVPAVPVAAIEEATPALVPAPRPAPRLAEVLPGPSLPSPVASNLPTADPLPLVGPDRGAMPAAAPADRGVAYERVREPRYPATARIRGFQGETVLRVLVAADGQVRSVTVAASSGHRELDQAALAAVRTWRFQPAIEQGRPVAAWVQVPVVFRLH